MSRRRTRSCDSLADPLPFDTLTVSHGILEIHQTAGAERAAQPPCFHSVFDKNIVRKNHGILNVGDASGRSRPPSIEWSFPRQRAALFRARRKRSKSTP